LVNTWGTNQHENFVYEWGQAEAMCDGGKSRVEKIPDNWQRQADGSWKIFRNMVILVNETDRNACVAAVSAKQESLLSMRQEDAFDISPVGVSRCALHVSIPSVH
jgi:hypothetical protein